MLIARMHMYTSFLGNIVSGFAPVLGGNCDNVQGRCVPVIGFPHFDLESEQNPTQVLRWDFF